MSKKYISCADTAKIIRQVLKESFADVKFSVKSKTYSGGASIGISWTDGPNKDQVNAVVKKFKAAYFDSSIDYQGSIYHMMNGEQVSFGADYINTYREFSDAAIQVAIDRVYNRYIGNFKYDGIEKPTVEQYKKGGTRNIQLSGLHFNYNQGVDIEILQTLNKHSDRLKVNPSKTAAGIFITHDDGYSMACGSGMSAVPVTL